MGAQELTQFATMPYGRNTARRGARGIIAAIAQKYNISRRTVERVLERDKASGIATPAHLMGPNPPRSPGELMALEKKFRGRLAAFQRALNRPDEMLFSMDEADRKVWVSDVRKSERLLVSLLKSKYCTNNPPKWPVYCASQTYMFVS